MKLERKWKRNRKRKGGLSEIVRLTFLGGLASPGVCKASLGKAVDNHDNKSPTTVAYSSVKCATLKQGIFWTIHHCPSGRTVC